MNDEKDSIRSSNHVYLVSFLSFVLLLLSSPLFFLFFFLRSRLRENKLEYEEKETEEHEQTHFLRHGEPSEKTARIRSRNTNDRMYLENTIV